MAISQDAKHITIVSYPGQVWSWTAGGGLRGPVVLVGGELLGRPAVAADGLRAVSGRGRDVLVWDLCTGQLAAALEGHAGRVTSVAVSDDGALAASGGSDCCVRVWDLASGSCLAVLQGHTSGIASVAISCDGRFVISGGDCGSLRVWQL